MAVREIQRTIQSPDTMAMAIPSDIGIVLSYRYSRQRDTGL
jgi:hypothetical protein